MAANSTQLLKYKADTMPEQLYKLCLLGVTNDQIADFFNINVDTITEWCKSYPEFREAYYKGKMGADAAVAASLYHRALGYKHNDEDIKIYEGQIIKTDTVKHYPPDTNAARYWLNNRRPKEWRDKTEIEHSQRVNIVDDLDDDDSVK